MPVPTASDAWGSAEPPERMEPKIIDFLSDSPTTAFTMREIGDKIGRTEWKEAEQYARKSDMVRREELDRDQFSKEFPLDGEYPTPRSESIASIAVEAVLRELHSHGLVDVRTVDTDVFEDRYYPDQETVRAYTFNDAL